MKIIIFSAILAVCGTVLASDAPAPVKIYCFSEALEAGFKDGDALFYCNQLGKRGKKKKSLVLVNERNSANVIAHYIGVEEYSERGEATFLRYGIAWTPTEDKTKETAIIQVGEFAKAVSGSGVNAQAAMELVRKTEEWIRENRETILQKTSK